MNIMDKTLFYLQILLPVPCVNLIQITYKLIKLFSFLLKIFIY